MAVPKKKRSYMRRHTRRAHHALKQTNLMPCGHCGEPTLPHRMCPNCNRYKGKLILPLQD